MNVTQALELLIASAEREVASFGDVLSGKHDELLPDGITDAQRELTSRARGDLMAAVELLTDHAGQLAGAEALTDIARELNGPGSFKFTNREAQFFASSVALGTTTIGEDATVGMFFTGKIGGEGDDRSLIVAINAQTVPMVGTRLTEAGLKALGLMPAVQPVGTCEGCGGPVAEGETCRCSS